MRSFGYGDELLYMEPILAGFLKEFPKTVMLNLETKAIVRETGDRVLKIAPWKNIFGPIAVFLSVMSYLWKTLSELIILSEFDQTTIFGIVFRFFHKRTRILLLVENDPCFLTLFYGVNRKNIVINILRRWIVSNADFILTNNDLGRRYLTDELNAVADKILVGPFLTSSILNKPTVTTKKLYHGECLRLLTVCRIIEGKGIHFLLQSLADIPVDILSRIHLTIVGEGPERQSMESLAVKYGLNRNVTFAGKCPYEKLDYYYANAHVFVFPTLSDYRALANFEALSAGLPIIGSIFDGAAGEAIEEGVNGFILDPRDTKVLSEKIIRFLNEPNLLERFSIESIKKSKNFSVDKAINNLVQACYQCCNETGSGETQ